MRTPYESCQRLVKVLAANTGIDWTFGYLGNVSGFENTPAYRDDRTWYAFAAHPGRVGTDLDRIGGVSTDRLDRLVVVLQGAVKLSVVLEAQRNLPVSENWPMPSWARPADR